THEGEFYQVDGARGRPGSVQQPRVPLLIAANGPRAMRMAAQHGDGWVTTGPQTASAPDLSEDPIQQRQQWWRGVEEMSERVSAAEAEHRPADAQPLRRYIS